MNKIIDKIYKCLNKRYGIDELYRFLLIVCLIIIVINIFLDSIILRILELVVFIYAIYRVLSKDRYKRQKENKKYIEIKHKIFNYFKYKKNKYRDRNTHMYKTCPKCGQKIRLPLKKGKHTVKCPSCKEIFEVRCRKDEKIKVEIVK